MSVFYGFAVLALTALTGRAPAAQPVAGDLRWFVGVDGADMVSDESRAYRLYSTTAPLRLALNVFNESETTALVDVGAFVDALDLQVSGRGDRPFAAELEAVQRPGRVGVRLAAGRVPVEPNTGLTVRLRLRPADDRPLEAGDYAIVLDVGRAAATVEDSSRRAWRGQVLRQATLTVTVAPPRDSAERVAMLAFQAHTALAENDLPSAEDLLLRALQEGPNLSLSCALGNLYVVQGRYREAIDTYEGASAGSSARDPQLLALAYLGLGAEDAAIGALRAGGWSETAIRTEMQLLRGIVARRAGSIQ